MIIPRGFGGIRTTECEDTSLRLFDYTERIWRYQDNYGREKSSKTKRLYREDLAVSGQLSSILTKFSPEIIPRGFGGIRTTLVGPQGQDFVIIPRGFGGIRTTLYSFEGGGHSIIPRGFGGIRTTKQPRSCCRALRLYREDLAVSGQQNNLDRVVVIDYTERIWRYQDNQNPVVGLYREDLAVSGQPDFSD